MKKPKMTIATTALILVLVTTMFVTLQPSSVAAQDETSTPENWIELITQTPGGAYREPPGITNYPRTTSPAYTEDKTGFSAGPGPETNHTLWRSDIPVNMWPGILADNGKIFVPSILGHTYYALDQYTGEIIWERNISSASMVPPTWYVNRWPQLAYRLLFVIDSGDTVALGQESGNTFFTIPGERPALTVEWPQVFADGDALYTTHGRNVSCYKLPHAEWPSYRLIWNRNTIRGRLAFWDHKIYGTGSYSTWCSCVDAATGDLIWNFTGIGDPKDTFYPSPTIAYGNVYLGTERGYDAPEELVIFDHVVCLDAETGAYKWTYETEEYFVQSISAAYGNIYIAGGERNAIHCVDAETGEKKWEYNAPGFIDYYDIQIADNKLYFVSAATAIEGFPVPGTFPGLMNCIDATTGEEIWSYLTDTSATSPLLVDGKLIASTEEDYLWCHAKGPTTTNIEIASTSLTLGQSSVIYGSVTDMSPFSQQHPELQSPVVAEVPVVLSYVNAGTWTDFATVNTDSAGTFMYNLTPSSIGAYNVVARFEGNDAYQWSSAQKLVQVDPAPAEPEPYPDIPEGITAEEVATEVLANLPEGPSAEDIAQEILKQLPDPEYPEYPEAPEYTTIDLAILTAVVVAIVIGAVSIYLTRKQQK